MASCVEHGEWDRKYLACPKCFKDGNYEHPIHHDKLKALSPVADAALREGAAIIVQVADMEEHNVAIFKGKWRKGAKAWSGDFIERLRKEGLAKLREAIATNAAPQASATLLEDRREGGPDTDVTREDAKPVNHGACGAAPAFSGDLNAKSPVPRTDDAERKAADVLRAYLDGPLSDEGLKSALIEMTRVLVQESRHLERELAIANTLVGTLKAENVKAGWPTASASKRADAALHACEGLATVDLKGNAVGWLAGLVNDVHRIEAENSRLTALPAELPGAASILTTLLKEGDDLIERERNALIYAVKVINALHAAPRPLPEAEGEIAGIYVASRVVRAPIWKAYRDGGIPINASWIDEAGEGETADFGELWLRIRDEIRRSRALVFYAHGPEDFPFKGALVEVGMALAMDKPVYVVLKNVKLDGRTLRPVGSWLLDRRVKLMEDLDDAIYAACEKPTLLSPQRYETK